MKFENEEAEVSVNQELSEEEFRFQAVRLSLISGIGPRMVQNLLGRFQTIPRIFAAHREELLSVAGVGPKIVENILAPDTLPRVEQEMERLQIPI